MRGYAQAGVVDRIRAAGGEVYAVTSEPHTLAREAHADWETAFEHVGDPHHEIEGTCRERGWLSLFSAQWGDNLHAEDDAWISHPKGYYQPGVLVVDRDGRVLYRWRCQPSYRNTGGATARPTPEYVWREIERARAEPAGSPDALLDLDPELDAGPTPFPVFVMILMANGWFLRPRVFTHHKGQGSIRGRLRTASMRLAGFVALWIAALVWLPTTGVAVAFALWLAIAIPGIRKVLRRFQDVAPDAEPA